MGSRTTSAAMRHTERRRAWGNSLGPCVRSNSLATCSLKPVSSNEGNDAMNPPAQLCPASYPTHKRGQCGTCGHKSARCDKLFAQMWPNGIEANQLHTSHQGRQSWRQPSRHATEPAHHPTRVPVSTEPHAGIRDRPERSHHLLQPCVHRGERVQPRRAAGPAPQHPASPRHAGRGLSGHVGHHRVGPALERRRQESPQERRPLLGDGQRHPDDGWGSHHRLPVGAP